MTDPYESKDPSPAYEEQHGPRPTPVYDRPRRLVWLRASRLPADPIWDQAWANFRRMRSQGLTAAEAVEVFAAFLNDPLRSSAAELVIRSFGGGKDSEVAKSGKAW